MADYITTYTGEHINPLEPDIEKIKIEDIAHSLSLQCRANGHFPRFYTVAQHCIDCMTEAKARHLSKRMQLAVLIHDAAEAYFGDIPSPVKKYFPEFEKCELDMLNLIYIKYLGSALNEKEKKLVADIDYCMFCHEFKSIMGEQPVENMPKIYSKPDFKTRPAIEMEEIYKRYVKKYIS